MKFAKTSTPEQRRAYNAERRTLLRKTDHLPNRQVKFDGWETPVSMRFRVIYEQPYKRSSLDYLRGFITETYTETIPPAKPKAVTTAYFKF